MQLNKWWQYVIRWFWDKPNLTWNMRMSHYNNLSASRKHFGEFIASAKMHISSRNTQTTDITHVDKSRFTCACSSELRWDPTHGDEEVLTSDKLYPMHQTPQTPIWLSLSFSFQGWRWKECVGSRCATHTYTHTHSGRHKRAVTGLTAAGLFSFLRSSAVCPLSLRVCVWERELSEAFPGPWPIRTVIHDKGNGGQPPQCFAPRLPGNRQFLSPRLS